MRSTLTKLEIALFLLLGINALIFGGRPQNSANSIVANIPKAWDDEAVASLEMPLADPRYSPAHVSSNYYYRMPGYKPYGVKTRAVKGHPFGLDLSADDRRSLIAFIKTL